MGGFRRKWANAAEYFTFASLFYGQLLPKSRAFCGLRRWPKKHEKSK
jgi:hypothetical protein